MRARTVIYSIVALAWLSSINAIMVGPEENITEGNCGGQLDYFLCNCTTSNTTVDIHLSPGRYYFMNRFCLLQNKTSIKFIGSSHNETIIECKGPFNIVFLGVQDISIINITMVNCGNVVNKLIYQTIHSTTNGRAHLGSNFRFAVMFYEVKDIAIVNFTMQNTSGYGIAAFNAIGNITISKFKTENATFINETSCNTYVTSNHATDFICSGSGIFITYFDNENKINTSLMIDQSEFRDNKNFLPFKQTTFRQYVISTNIYAHQAAVPLQGAAGIAIFYSQNLYNVDTAITNSSFHNNNGTLSASIAIGSISTIKGKTLIKNCSFDDNNRIKVPHDITAINRVGAISYYYLAFNDNLGGPEIEIVTIVQCNFARLGGTLGAGIHIEKISANSQPLSVRIERCNFVANEANAGSAIYAADHRFDATLSNGLIINLVNVNAINNTLLPGSTVEYGSGHIITGVFHGENCHFKFNCSLQCMFLNNQPSVFYGHASLLTISGKAMFINNKARRGGGLSLLNTVAFIEQHSEIYFGYNHATTHGGAIDIFLSNTHIATQDVCPIQFIGSSNNTIFSLENITKVKLNVTFKNNTAVSKSIIQSIHANVFYVCTWYPNTLTQVELQPIINGTRQSVYHQMFHFIPNNTNHLSILADLPCPCDNNNTYDPHYCLTANDNDTLELNFDVILGRSFTISFMTLDAVGSIGYSSNLYSEVSSVNTTDNVLTLPSEQFSRSFSIIRNKCTPINFTIYALQPTKPQAGILHLSLSPNSGHHFHFNFGECPVGFRLQNVSGLFACTCGEIFNDKPINKDFECNSVSGKIKRIQEQSWLSAVKDRVEYTGVCLPQYCHDMHNVTEFQLTDRDVLCKQNHTGRACKECIDGYSKTFGSTECEECEHVWLFTILLYGIVGIILILIIHLLKLTVTMGTINGLIFFCNIIGINENLLFEQRDFHFIKVFVSLINLDLGFKICFYKGMSQIAKTGFQFVFPLYLWLLMFIIIMLGKRYMHSKRSTRSAVPVLATLILLSYSKILRTTISVFSFVDVYTTNDSNFSTMEKLLGWQPDPNVKYLKDGHIALFLVAMAFTVLFILPLAFALTFPKVVLRSKRFSYFFPLLDCIYAPYKDQYRYWLGVRIILLVYLSGMEAALFSYQDALLLSGLVAVLLFACIQAYIHPFKNIVNNFLDLIFMGIFVILGVIILYLNPDDLGNEEFTAVTILGSVAFILFCVIIIFHLHDALLQFTQYKKFMEWLKIKFNMKNVKSDWYPLRSVAMKDVQKLDDSTKDNNYAYLQESLLEERFD